MTNAKGGKIRFSDFLGSNLIRKKSGPAEEKGREQDEATAPDCKSGVLDRTDFREKNPLPGKSDTRNHALVGDSTGGSGNAAKSRDFFRFKDLMEFRGTPAPEEAAREEIAQSSDENKEQMLSLFPEASSFLYPGAGDAVPPGGAGVDKEDGAGPERDILKEDDEEEKRRQEGAGISLREEKTPQGKTAVTEEGASEEAVQIYSAAAHFLQQAKESVVRNNAFAVEPAVNLIARITGSPELIDKMYSLTIPVTQDEDYNISHQINTMVYTIKMGKGFSYSGRKLGELALAALLHDVGMFQIPEKVTGKFGKLTDEDLALIKRHPEFGRKILNNYEGGHPVLAEAAYQHHERESGQGYPRGLSGLQIMEFSKIISIVDSYEAMTHNRPYRKALMQAFSAKELIKSKHSLFAPNVIKVFLKEISLYPLGSYVRLNNRAIGRVVATDQSRPLRPEVLIIFDAEGHRVFENIVLKLDENPIFYIQDSISEDELPNVPSQEF